MIARIQASITLLTLLAALAIASAVASAGRGGLGVALGVAVLMLPAAVFAMQFLLMRAVNRQAGRPVASFAVLTRAYFCEFAEFIRVFAWRQPFRSVALPDVVEGRSGIGVVFIHGYLCNRGLWNPWYRKLNERGTAYVGVSLEPPFSSIDDFVSAVEKAVSKIESATGRPPILVCHSMGGLVARAWLRSNTCGGRNDDRISKVITIATPHGGTWLARFSGTANGRQMREMSTWLTALQLSETDARRSKFICLHGDCDNIVFPLGAATLDGAEQHRIDGTGHLRMAFHPATLAAFTKVHAAAERQSGQATRPTAQEY